MSRVVIANPIINSPFQEPQRHFLFSEEGITDEIATGRRQSEYFVPIARPRKKSKQLQMAFEEWTQDRIRENKFINRVRERVALWRRGGYVGIARTTRRLLEYWTHPERERKLFFCQIEALETAIYLTEVAHRHGDNWIANELRRGNEDANPLLYRVAFKMATGSGKTVVMAMLIAWQTLNKIANRQDARFSDAFLIVTPGITIRDRLRVLLPSDPNNYYHRFDVVPPDLMPQLHQAKIVVTNFHAFQLRERVKAGRLTKELLTRGETSPFTETPGQMVRRVCRELGNKKNIIVINDEGHHCYRRKPDSEKERLSRDERKEARKREAEARVWISGLEAVKAKIGVKLVYDLSATPFFLRGSGYPEGTLFPWVISDFSLIDAIECGIVKVPRVPVDDNAMIGDYPTYRHLWPTIRDDLPKKGRGTSAISGEPKLPAKLESALHSLYNNYGKYHQLWEESEASRDVPPPVFIVVCSNTNVSKMMYDYISGWEKELDEDHTVLVPGAMGLFSNVRDGRWRARPNTILIDSAQLESGEAMSAEFTKIAAREIEEFKAEYRQRFPGRDADSLTDEDLLREVMNTVGKPGKLGEHVKCVVSVSMLTEGWDASTVTHILGVRAFGTQLLCEQVVGRGLRRISYATETRRLQMNGSTIEFEAFPVEYAEVYGVPFSFIPTRASANPPQPGPRPTRVRALEERIDCEITFPRAIGYRYELPGDRLTVSFDQDSYMAISTQDVPTRTENAPIVGESSIHTLYDLMVRREQQLARTRLMTARYPYYLLSDSPEGIRKTAEAGGQLPPTPLPKTYSDIRQGFVYRQVPHITLRDIARNEEIDTIHEKWQQQLELLRAQLNDLLSKSWQEWEIPRKPEVDWPQAAVDLLQKWWQLRRERQAEIDASIARHSDSETLYDQPYEDPNRIRVAGPFTVESLSPHRVLTSDEVRPASEQAGQQAQAGGFERMIIANLKKAGVQNTKKNERLRFDRLDPYAGEWIQAEGEYTEKLPSPASGEGPGVRARRVAVAIGPEHGTVGPMLLKEAAKEAVRGLGFDLLIVCGFAFDPHVAEETRRYGKLTVLTARMNPDLAMGDTLLKKTGSGNLFMVFGEPDVDIRKADGKVTVEIQGLDIYDPTTGEIRSSSTDDIACWFIDTDYNEESFFVRHAYFTGADRPYDKLKRALRAEIDEEAWAALYSTVSRPFDVPETGKIAVKVINHYGDEVLKVYDV